MTILDELQKGGDGLFRRCIGRSSNKRRPQNKLVLNDFMMRSHRWRVIGCRNRKFGSEVESIDSIHEFVASIIAYYYIEYVD